ncbi:hypothetical protein H6S82_03075 [Planktothrix sp. FACHB-1355]|uniref:Uncharacterized protein n=1 Tax=Aerosakkonema funiforme FACHB-1375 TaxID=2949571 RepID=A0A926VJU3_9CYAN|nr:MULTISPECIES: hypothetical protein [Oscillatoriales]MBD2184107.1 hypothetical protein [Aerosakkonema funiforme FACHB-1375]MBD3557839.1 hypothetical protein [Planktothrix sp. FACHB-1355]
MQLNNRIDSSIVTMNSSALAIRKSGGNVTPKNWQSLIKVTLGGVYLVLILALPAAACGSYRMSNFEFGSLLFVLPAIVSFYGYGIPLLTIILIEAYILHKRESIPYLKACGFTTLANIFYLLACFVSYASFFSLFFPISIISSAISAAMCLSFCQRTGYLKNISQRMFILLVYLFFMGLGVASSVMVESISASAERNVLYAVTAGILLIGFIFGFVAKGFAIARNLREKRPSLASTVMSMQVGSFPIVAIAYYMMQNQQWF